MTSTQKAAAEAYRAAIEAGSEKRIRVLMRKGIKAYPQAILAALLRKQIALIPVLKEAGADPDARDAFGKSALRHAANFLSAHEVKVILEVGANPNKDSLGLLPLVIATTFGHIDIVKLLIEFGADVNRAQNNGLTALWEATRYGYRDIVQLLVEAGADPRHGGPDGSTPIELAKKNHRDDLLGILEIAKHPKNKKYRN